MPYAIQTDLEERYSPDEIIAVADRDGDGVADAAVVAAAIADASELIDGYLAGRYALPLVTAANGGNATVPGLVKNWCCDIARRRLHKDSPTEEVLKNHDEALRQLRDVAAGRLTLQVAGVTSTTIDGGSTVLVDAPPRIFDRDSLGAF